MQYADSIFLYDPLKKAKLGSCLKMLLFGGHATQIFNIWQAGSFKQAFCVNLCLNYTENVKQDKERAKKLSKQIQMYINKFLNRCFLMSQSRNCKPTVFNDSLGYDILVKYRQKNKTDQCTQQALYLNYKSLLQLFFYFYVFSLTRLIR